ncbi:Ig-like domain-containing protein [Metabacillus sp. RGM 3146]|uniref:Ig-like domain-containing protein n=1 Tax=Metabacillus sp. RGM 3146 TaxID=3401092 RepID=UPI003B9C3301
MKRKSFKVLAALVMGILVMMNGRNMHALASEDNDIQWVKILPEKIEAQAGQAVPLSVLVKKKECRPFLLPQPSFLVDDEETAFVKQGKLFANKPGKTIVRTDYEGVKDESIVEVKKREGNHSVYESAMVFPEEVSAGVYVPVPVSIETKEVRKKGYDDVYFKLVKAEGPGDVVAAVQSEPKRVLLNSGELLESPADLSPDYDQTIPTEMKFTKSGKYKLTLEMSTVNGDFLSRSVSNVVVQPSFQDLGVQIKKLMAMRGAYGRDENGRAAAYTVLAGRPAMLAVTDVETERVTKVLPLPDAEAAWAVTVASDGTVYAGSTPNGSIYKYVPGSDAVINLGKPVPNQTVIWDLTAGKDGKVYGGTYYNGHTFEYDPKKGFTDFGEMVPKEEYVRSVAYDENENALYAGVGAHAHLIKYDLGTGKKTDVLPEAYKKYISVYDLQAEGGKLFIKLEPEFKLLVVDQKTLKVEFETLIHSRGVSPLSPDGKKVYYTANNILYEYDLEEKNAHEVMTGNQNVNVEGPVIGFGYSDLQESPFGEKTLVGYSGNYEGRFFKYNLNTGALKNTFIPLPPQSTTIYNIGSGPDGKIYSSGFIGGDLGIYSPMTGKTEQQTGLGQVEGLTSIGSKMFFGVYPMARIFEYDTAKPWNKKTNLKELFNLHGENEQNRPVAMTSLPERNEIYAGTIPDYGKIGGSLSSYNLDSGQVSIHRNIVENQSIISVAKMNGFIYAGSSIYGGTGSLPAAKEAKLIGWDPSSSKKLFETAPVPGKGSIGALYSDENGMLWGIAQDTLFIFDPVSQKTVYQEVKFPDSGAMRIGTELIKGNDGYLYGTLNQKFFRINMTSKDVTVLKDHASKIAKDALGNFYFIEANELSNGNNIWRYTIEDPIIRIEDLLLNRTNVTLSQGRITQLTVKILPEFATNKNVTWRSSNSGVAMVDQTGLVTGVSEGTATVTVQTEDGRIKKTAEIKVES